MRAEDLDVKEFVEFDSDAGEIRLAGRRALLIDATALGMLRKELIESLGLDAARLILTRFGFVHGWNMAEALRSQFKWESPEDYIRASGRLHMIEGLYQVGTDGPGPLSKEGRTLFASFEADQHMAHLGRSDSATCWMICGLTSGFLSRALDQEIFVLEDRCIGKGDASCCLLARTRAEWEELGESRAEELRFFRRDHLKDWLDDSLHHVAQTLKRVEQRLSARKRALEAVAADVADPMGVVARSDSMRRLVDLARRIAKVDSTVLITGESGTGKERVARLVHEESARSRGPFIAVNCGAVMETLLESELFGHARGSFTGAVSDRPGLFEAANGGTLLLDEIGEVSPGMQVKLLRTLQEREVRRVGENRSRAFNVRVIAATNSDLTADIVAGRFRKDLYYRLNVVELNVPPLRARREDILPLARVLLGEAALRLKRPMVGLSPAAAEQLLKYDWPGNVRELENAMERSVALSSVNRTEVDDLPEEVRKAVPRQTLSDGVKTLEEIEKDHILAVLALNDGNQARTAETLDIGTATLYRKLKKYGALRGP